MTRRLRPGFYNKEINQSAWVVPERYQNLKQVGAGAYGTVCYALDTKTGAKVAIKKLYRPFQSETFAKRAFRELRLIKHMKHENVIGLLDVFTPDISLDRFHDFYIVMPYMGTDLGKLMRKLRLSDERIQYLGYQMLKGLKYIHSAGIIHRILDFGLARQADSEMTGYVVTRWYRAPEVILNWMHYTQTVDIWSVGCIMAEMLQGRALFKGADHIDQLEQIWKVTGTPTPEFISKLESEDAKDYLKKVSSKPKADLHKLFSALFSVVPPSLAVTVLEHMLLLDPEERITAAEALALPYFSEFRGPEEETACELFDYTLVNAELGVDQWKRHTFTEILTFKPVLPNSKESTL
uniref:mitogen-activated protein kinase n=1 Tax=Kryptolebias marmoratus TaxID=37003 RepID=A0A3Q3BK50_KRYMA